MAGLDLDVKYSENSEFSNLSNLSNLSNPWDDLIKAECNIPEKILSSTNCLLTNKTKTNLKTSNKINKEFDDNKVLTINEIINLKSDELKITKNLEYQYVITKHLKNNLKNINDNKGELLKKLLWLIESINFLIKKFNLEKIQIKKTNDIHTIYRSSYKFCKYNYKCKYLCNNNIITNNCFEQHIVFNYLFLDIDNLINYINNNTEYNINEIQKSINTIYYVINHIKEELENIRDVNNFNLDSI